MSRLDHRLRAELAANAENAVQLHRLSARLVRAQEDERRLIARELHDEVGQALTAVKMQLALARRSVPDNQAGAIDEARSITDAALQSARQISRLLHPPMLEDTGLAATLDWYLKGFSERTGVRIEFVHAGMEERAAPEVETCLFRVVQEATTNIARHAVATSCRVYLQRLPASVVLTVEDTTPAHGPPAGQHTLRHKTGAVVREWGIFWVGRERILSGICGCVGAVEQRIRNLVARRVLVTTCGAFIERWATIAKSCGREVETLAVPWGQAVTPEALRAAGLVSPTGRR